MPLLRIAGELLDRGIEQFREENQGPILKRASELFATLTAGSFQGLRLDENDRGEPVLFGMRGEKIVGVEGMSDGSCDQLYLALRLASLESWLVRHEPIPLIADDILLNFDDERSAAALIALDELSQHTQILFFFASRTSDRSGPGNASGRSVTHPSARSLQHVAPGPLVSEGQGTEPDDA